MLTCKDLLSHFMQMAACNDDEWYQEIDALMDKTATVQPLALVARSAS